MNPLVLLLDAALAGELDVVQQAVSEVSPRPPALLSSPGGQRKP